MATAAIVTIGDELLIGQVIDTNSVFIAKELEKIGCQIVEKRAIADNLTNILQTFQDFQDRVDLVIFTGGLGPTKDDVTKKAWISYFEDELVKNEEVYFHVKTMLENIYKRPLSEANQYQAYLPSKSIVLFNEVGTAPGMLYRKSKTAFISLPGVPYEMKHLIEKQVLPYVSNNFILKNIYHHTLVAVGIGESLLAEKIKDWEEGLVEQNIALAYLPQIGMVRLRLTAIGSLNEDVQSKVLNEVKHLKQLISEYLISENEEDTLLDVVVDLLKKNKQNIAFAESCTGGLLAQNFAKQPGASEYFKGGAVTYATESKINVLGVSKEAIDSYSVVSEQVALEMAQGARRIFQSDFTIATTGNAGPSKGDSDVEVGTVCIAICTPKQCFTQTLQLGQPREKVIELTIQKSLFELYKILKKD